jgi:hypothetical protein
MIHNSPEERRVREQSLQQNTSGQARAAAGHAREYPGIKLGVTAHKILGGLSKQ